MAKLQRHQELPTRWGEREALREKGQFWTPEWVVEAMVAYVLQGNPSEVFDPAVGAGVFLRVAKKVSQQLGVQVSLAGCELDADALAEAAKQGLTADDLKQVQIADFLRSSPERLLQATVANPPYIRHHRMSAERKAELRQLCKRITGMTLDARAGIHVYFLLHALERLAPGGRLSFIMPADTVEGIFAPRLWRWITDHYRLDAVITFAPEATPFPGVDTNPLVLCIANAQPAGVLRWARCEHAHRDDLKTWVLSGFAQPAPSTIHAAERPLEEALASGLSRPPQSGTGLAGRRLGEFARVLRGIATGCNEFFFLTEEQATELELPDEYLRLAVGRTRDVSGAEITAESMQALARRGRPTRLLYLDDRPARRFPVAVQRYLARGEKLGLPERPLIRQRRPWYKMEQRAVPPFLFAYLGRRNARFIRNDAGVLPLTGFLCVYPLLDNEETIARLWRVLSHPDTVANLALVGKSYGEGAIKVEPRALEQLTMPAHALEEAGLTDAFGTEQLGFEFQEP